MKRLKRILSLFKFTLGLSPRLIRRNYSKSFSESTVNWAIVGTGYMAITFSKALLEDSDARIIAVSSRDYILGLIFSFGLPRVRPFKGHIRLLEEVSHKIDIVYIATPVKTHFQIIMDCLNANCNVLCEKPLCFSSEEVFRIKSTAEDKGLFVMEGLWTNFLPTMKKAKELLLSGAIGSIKSIKIVSEKAPLNYNHDGIKSMLLDFGIYTVAFIRYFLNNLDEIKVVDSFESNESVSIIIENEKDDILINGVISAGIRDKSSAIIEGDLGMIVWGNPFNRTNTFKHIDFHTGDSRDYSFNYSNEGFEYEIEHVHNCLDQNRLESEILPLNLSGGILKTIERFT